MACEHKTPKFWCGSCFDALCAQRQQAQEELRTTHDADVLSIRRLTEERDKWLKGLRAKVKELQRALMGRSAAIEERDEARARGEGLYLLCQVWVNQRDVAIRDVAEQRALVQHHMGTLCRLQSHPMLEVELIRLIDDRWETPAEALRAKHRSPQSGQARREGGRSS